MNDSSPRHRAYRYNLFAFLCLIATSSFLGSPLGGCNDPTICLPQQEPTCRCDEPPSQDDSISKEPDDSPESAFEPPSPERPEALPEASPAERPPENPPITLPTRCEAPKIDFYQQTWTEETLSKVPAGSVLRCERLGQRSLASIAIDPLFLASGGSPTTGYKLFRLIYRSEGVAGKAVATSALVYLPQDANQACQQAPLTVVAHGTVGSAPLCGPSRSPAFSIHYMTLPLAGRGHLVIAPDYTGLGLPSTTIHPYLVVEPTAATVLDSIKAGQWLAKTEGGAACASNQTFLLGHSQGGHAALIAAERFQDRITDRTLTGVISYAPAFGDPRVWLGPFSVAAAPTSGTAYLLLYLLGLSAHTQTKLETWLKTRALELVPPLAQQFCLGEFTSLLLQNFATIGDIFTDHFLQAAQRCNAGQGDCNSWTPWYQAIRDTQPGGKPTTSPLLVVQGSLDTLVTSASIACMIKRYPVQILQTCIYPTADHTNIVGLSWPSVLPWISARQAGQTTPATCPSAQLPSCP